MSILSVETLLESGKLFKKNFQSRSLDTCAASSTQCPNFQGLFTSKVTWYYKWNLKPKRWIWENCNANGKMTKNKCVSYWTRDISSWSLEEKLHWYNITHGVNSSLLIQSWQELFIRKKLSVIIFRYFMKLSRWERKIKIWENCNANGKMTKNKCVSYWTRDILSWSLEEKLHFVQYNSRCEFILIDSVMAGCNMSCFEEKRGFADCECFTLKEKELNLNHRLN